MDIKLEDFNRYRTKLLAYSKALTRNWSTNNYEYEDIVQNAYLQYHRFCVNSNFKLESHQNLEKLLINILYRAYSRSIDSRYKDVMPKYNEVSTNFNYFSDKFHPEETINTNIDIESFRTLLNSKQVIVFDLVYRGYKLTEIAEIKNISKQAVFDRLSTIKKKFTRWLE